MRSTVAAAIAALGLVATACSDTPGSTPASTTTTALAPSTTLDVTTIPESATTLPSPPESSAAPTTTSLPPGDPSQASVTATVIATIDEPIATAIAPDGGVWLAQRNGRVVQLDPTTGEIGETILDISDLTTAGGERGLLSIAVDADHLYVDYTDRSGDSNIDAYVLDSDGRPRDRRPLLQLDQPFANHNGGAMAIGPDGMLYVGFGDGGSGGDPLGSGQDPTTLLGSVIRIDPKPDGDSAYSIPPENPFADGVAGRPEIFMTGLRNPWRFAFDPVTDDLWLADVGQDRFEEIDLLLGSDGWGRGGNLGWNNREGFNEFAGGGSEGFIEPVFEYSHGGNPGGCSVTGGLVYRGEQIPELQGAYLFGDFCTARLWALSASDDGFAFTDLDLEVPGGVLASFGVDSNGEVLLLSLSGQISRLEPADS